MRLTIITDDNNVTVDGVGHEIPVNLDANIHAVQWDGVSGEIEYRDNTPNLEITDVTQFQSLLDVHAAEGQRLVDEETAAQAAANTSQALALAEINRLESQVTNRRLREATLTDEGKTWLTNQEALIAAERAKL